VEEPDICEVSISLLVFPHVHQPRSASVCFIYASAVANGACACGLSGSDCGKELEAASICKLTVS